MRHIQIVMSYSRHCWGRAKSVSLSPVALSLWQRNGWNLCSGKPQNWKYFLLAPCRMSRQSPDTIYGSEGKCHGRKLEKQTEWCNGMKNEDICEDNKVEKSTQSNCSSFWRIMKILPFSFPYLWANIERNSINECQTHTRQKSAVFFCSIITLF